MAQRMAEAQKERRNRIIFVTIGVVIFALVIGIAIWGIVASQTKSGTDIPPNTDADLNGIMLAPRVDGAPTFEIFSDYNCSACKQADLTLGAVLKQASDTGKVNVILHGLSNYTTSREADIAAACADFQGKFWDYHNQLFINQGTSGFDDTMLTVTIPDNIGLVGDELTAFQTCVSTQATGSFVDDEAKYASKRGVGPTPSFFLDGTSVPSTDLYNTNTNSYDPDKLREVLGM